MEEHTTDNGPMVVGVRLDTRGPVRWFDPGPLVLHPDDFDPVWELPGK